MNAIELAEKLHIEWRDDSLNYDTALAASFMLREQHEAILKLREALENLVYQGPWSAEDAAKQLLKDTAQFDSKSQPAYTEDLK